MRKLYILQKTDLFIIQIITVHIYNLPFNLFLYQQWKTFEMKAAVFIMRVNVVFMGNLCQEYILQIMERNIIILLAAAG